MGFLNHRRLNTVKIQLFNRRPEDKLLDVKAGCVEYSIIPIALIQIILYVGVIIKRRIFIGAYLGTSYVRKRQEKQKHKDK